VRDDSGALVRLSAPAQRIVTLSPHTAELVFAAGAGKRLVGTVAFSDYPAEAARIPRIGDAARLDREQLLMLHPDLVIAWPSGNRPQDLAWLERQGMVLYRSEPATLEAIADNLLNLGRLTGSRSAVRAAADYSNHLARLRRQYAGAASYPVLYQVWPSPLITLGARHLVSQVLELCGGRPLFPGLTEAAPRVSREAVILADPYAIVAGSKERDSDPFAAWRHWPSLDAVRHDRLIVIPPDLLQRPTPRILEGAERLCRALQGNPALAAHQRVP
jgi:iron complex transport system substrate-binding protein